MNQATLFDEVYAVYFPALYAYFSVCLGRDAADDLSQQLFLRVWRLMEKPAFRPPESWKAYLFSAAVNHKNDYLRRKQRQPESFPFDEALDGSPVRQEEDILQSVQVTRALDSLRVEDRELLLFKYAGLTSPEIGDILQLSDSAVRSRLSKAKEHFKQKLSENGVNCDEPA